MPNKIYTFLSFLALQMMMLTAIPQQIYGQNANKISTSEVFRMLDDEVAHRKEKIEVHEHRIDSLRQILSYTTDWHTRYDKAFELYQLYYSFNADSALHYSWICLKLVRDNHGDACLEQKSQLEMALNLGVGGFFKEAQSIMDSIQTCLCPDNRSQYFETGEHLNAWAFAYANSPSAKDELLARYCAFRDSVIQSSDDRIYAREMEALTYYMTDLSKSTQMMIDLTDELDMNDDHMRVVANMLGNNYLALGDTAKAEHYLAISALSDIRHNVMEHTSLDQVATLLYQRGDLDHAYQYINCSLEDAAYCNARLRIVQLSQHLGNIIDAYHAKVAHQSHILKITTICLALLLTTLAAIAFFLFHSRRRLSEARQKLLKYHNELRQNKLELERLLRNEQAQNQSLKESNRIKVTYVTQYMKQCSETLAKIEQYRLMLQKVAMQSNMAKLVSTIKSTEIIDKELDEFYKSFDETFLGLFPNFVSEFNALLKPEEQLPLPDPGRLNTQLRIFALIQLGITDSEEIATFLRYSIKTIYNYRTRTRNRASGDRDDLEKKLGTLGAV